MSSNVYELGPLRIEAEAWPASWVACAQGWLAPSAEPANYTVAWDGVGLSPDDERDAFATKDLLVKERRGATQWRVRGGGSFVAEIDESARRVRVQTRSELEDPSLALGNTLRALMATAMPTAFDGLMLHACAGVRLATETPGEARSSGSGNDNDNNNEGVVVAGVSTAGKTTLALGFAKTAYLSDDVALVANIHAAHVDAPPLGDALQRDAGPTLLHSPFFGAAGLPSPPSSPRRTPLRAIGILTGKRPAGTRSSYRRASAAQGAMALLQHVARFTNDRALSARLFDLAASLAQRVPVVLVERSLEDCSDDVVDAILAEARC